ncbi:uncharacterized protein MELLADRAFT_93627 [Melampsora larici-populina 98AG31]|uniref:Uncharacterized protein n=1 Tax=Melampsora larici-populina (strain 98AG31 / pathotype 3-4-7) TaxID=747676 RepID=F4R9W0_MELLP|nr:uncharacterized protein MELLADRAFT_93627 [Melampsora larici-populina 98AG31]EGG10596.1 hypothetical protein MELLADRAFT_93627 [Melampsora larici-populina 98AG31]
MPYFCLAMLYLYIQMDDTKSRLQEFQSTFSSNDTERIQAFPHYYIIKNFIMDVDGLPTAPHKDREAELKKMAAKRQVKKRTKTFSRPPNPDVSSPNFKRKPSTPKHDHHQLDSEEDNLMTPPYARSPHQITTVPVVIVPSVTPAPARAQTPQLVNLGPLQSPPAATSPSPKRNRLNSSLPDPSKLVIDHNRSKHYANDPILDVSPPIDSNRTKSSSNNSPSHPSTLQSPIEVGPKFIFSSPLSVDAYKSLLGPKVILNKEPVYPSDEIKSCIYSMYSEVFKHFKGRIAINEEEIINRAKVLRKLHFIGRKGLEKRSSPGIVPILEILMLMVDTDDLFYHVVDCRNDSEASSTGSSSKGKGCA